MPYYLLGHPHKCWFTVVHKPSFIFISMSCKQWSMQKFPHLRNVVYLMHFLMIYFCVTCLSRITHEWVSPCCLSVYLSVCLEHPIQVSHGTNMYLCSLNLHNTAKHTGSLSLSKSFIKNWYIRHRRYWASKFICFDLANNAIWLIYFISTWCAALLWGGWCITARSTGSCCAVGCFQMWLDYNSKKKNVSCLVHKKIQEWKLMLLWFWNQSQY